MVTILSLLRVKDWYYHLGFIYLGLIYATGHYLPDPWFFCSSMAIGSVYLALGYGYNAFCSSPERTGRLARQFLIIMGISAAGAVLLLGRTGLFVIAGMVLNYFYSHPKYNLKRNHLLSVGINGYLFGVLFLIGSAAATRNIAIGQLSIFIFFVSIMGMYQIIHEIAHLREDGIVTLQETARRYVNEAYTLMMLSGMIAYVIFQRSHAGLLFIISSVLFNLVFFAAMVTVVRRSSHIVEYAQAVRVWLRYVGFLYGGILTVSFSRAHNAALL